MRPPVAATRHHRLRDPRTGRRLRRDLARQPLSRTGRRHPVAVVPVPLRTEPELDPLLRARARDQPVSARHRAHAQPLSAPAHRVRGHPAGLGRRGVAVASGNWPTVRRSPPGSSSARSAGTSTPNLRSTSTASRTSRGRCCGPTTGTTPMTSRGKRVAVIGTGSSGVQIAAALCGRGGTLDVYQRTPGLGAAQGGLRHSAGRCARSSGCRGPFARSMRSAAG